MMMIKQRSHSISAGKRWLREAMAMRHEQRRREWLTSHWVRVNGWWMHYRVAGKGRQALVLVHGLTVSGNYLLPTAAELLDDFTVYIPDLPGFGASDKPRRVLEIVELADVLKVWMDAAGLERAYLLGNSLGCHTVTAAAARHREQVAGVILVAPAGEPGGRNMLRLVARGLNDFVREPPSLWRIMLRDFWKAGFRRTVLTLRSLQKFRLEAWLPRADVPALVVGGGQDRIVPAWWVRQVAALLPQSEAAMITEAGHVPNFSHPAKLAALVRAFVESEEGIGIPLTRQRSPTLATRRGR
jgi:2-hydroxy-6-oxonona-2,4-dienedioate hydrolase